MRPERVLIIAAVSGLASMGAGFHYDSRTNRYFSDGSPGFSFRTPLEDKRAGKLEASLNAGNWEAFDGKFDLKKEGLYSIRFRSPDPTHQWTPIQEFRVYVDLTPPVTSPDWEGQTFKSEKTFYVGPGSRLRLLATDSLSGVKKTFWKQLTSKEDSATEAGVADSKVYSGGLQFKAEGNYALRFASDDNVGNREAWQEIRFTVDGKSPQTTAKIPGGMESPKEKGTWLTPVGAAVQLSATDEASGVGEIQYQIDDGPVTPYSGPIAIEKAKCTVKFRAIDRVGNTEAWKTIQLATDSQPPRIAVDKTGTSIANRGRLYALPGLALELKASDDESGVREIWTSHDGKEFEKASRSTVIFKEAGTHTVAFRAVDAMGNLTESDSYTVIIDSLPPKTELRSTQKMEIQAGVMFCPVPNRIELVAQDEGVGVDRIEFSFDGKTFETYTQGIDPAQWTQARKTLYFRAVDRLGNREPTQSAAIQVMVENSRLGLAVESERLPEVPLSALPNRDPASPSGGSP